MNSIFWVCLLTNVCQWAPTGSETKKPMKWVNMLLRTARQASEELQVQHPEGKAVRHLRCTVDSPKHSLRHKSLRRWTSTRTQTQASLRSCVTTLSLKLPTSMYTKPSTKRTIHHDATLTLFFFFRFGDRANPNAGTVLQVLDISLWKPRLNMPD